MSTPLLHYTTLTIEIFNFPIRKTEVGWCTAKGIYTQEAENYNYGPSLNTTICFWSIILSLKFNWCKEPKIFTYWMAIICFTEWINVCIISKELSLILLIIFPNEPFQKPCIETLLFKHKIRQRMDQYMYLPNLSWYKLCITAICLK